MSSDETSLPRAGERGAPCRGAIALLLLIFIAGACLRMFAPPAFRTNGHDEILYMGFVEELDAYSITCYPKLVQLFNSDRETLTATRLPPTRFLYIFCGYCWDQVFHQSSGDGSLQSQVNALKSLHAISCLFSILTMLLAAWFAFRLGGIRAATGVLALVACSPMQIYVSRHALIDGFFAFWALLSIWLLWENLQNPGRWRWLAAYTLSIALMVLTKENAFFVFVALNGILIVNHWAKFGTVNRAVIACTYGGAVLGTAGLALLCGGLDHAVETYMILVRNASQLTYAIETGDGPWYRYLCELLVMSPFILLLAVGAVFRLGRENKAQIYLLSFVAFSYLVMCNVKYGMNLRYTNMWDMPLRFLAFWQLGLLCANFGRRQALVLAGCVAFLCLFDLRQYNLFFVQNHIYEPVPKELMHAVKIFVN